MNVMDTVLDMKRASEGADKLESDGAKYCGWNKPSLDTSDLDLAISRFLLNHGSHVPEDFKASKMWRVSFVTADMIHQFAVGVAECELNLRYSNDARSVAIAGMSILTRFTLARSKFTYLAAQQTLWQEKKGIERGDIERSGERRTSKVVSGEIVRATWEIKDATDSVDKVTTLANSAKECLHDGSPSEATDLTNLNQLVDRVASGSLLAGNMWAVAREEEVVQLGVLLTLGNCSVNAGEKKKARNIATQSFQAYRRLTKAIAAFDALALQQTESEEQAAGQQPPVVQDQ